MEASGRKHPLTVVLVILVLVMGVEIILLISQNRRLRALLAEAPALQLLQPGRSVPPLTATDLGGSDVTIRYGDRMPSTVLIWFSPACHVCGENASFWNEIYDRYQVSEHVRFLVLSDGEAEETRAYVTEHGLRFPVVVATDESLIEAYNGGIVPQTALVSPRGAIERVWPGALESTRREEITTALDSLAT